MKRNTELTTQMQVLLDQVSEQLQFVSHERRSQMTLGEYLSKYHHSNTQTLRQYSKDLLNQVIETKFGKTLKTP